MHFSHETFDLLLHELADWMKLAGCPPVDWVVCGGAAMAMQNLQLRTTRDVDVLGQWDSKSLTIACIEDFPEDIKTCIQRVVDHHSELVGLGKNWINPGPRKLVTFSLPEGFETRITVVKNYGDQLTLRLLGRVDLLALKLYAAADDLGVRQDVHFGDLRAMNPTFDELDSAVNWTRTLPDFEEKRLNLQDVVRRLGYDDLTYYI